MHMQAKTHHCIHASTSLKEPLRFDSLAAQDVVKVRASHRIRQTGPSKMYPDRRGGSFARF